MSTSLSFAALPTEILQAILQHLPPESLIAVSQTSKALNQVADSPVIWRHYCRTLFRYWNPAHNIATKFKGPLSDVDWRSLFKERLVANKQSVALLDKVLAGQRSRYKHINEIADLGYDVKGALLKEYDCPDDAEDVLARRYFAKAVLERIHREMAINVWKDLAAGKEMGIERALGAYDLFTTSTGDRDLDSILQDLDALAERLLQDHPDFQEFNTRQKALTLASFLRARGFNGASDASYHALRNSFIGTVLAMEDHQSLPLISVAIYCALAQRVGLDARPCGLVHHVYGIVYAPQSTSLEGKYLPGAQELEYMYIDPFRSETEVSEATLRTTLNEMGVRRTDHPSYLRDASVSDLVLRTARNIMTSVQTIRQAEAGFHAGTGFHPPTWAETAPDVESAFYSTLWAPMILGPATDVPDDSGVLASLSTRRRQYLPYLIEHFQTHYPWDVTLFEQHVIPLFFNLAEGHRLIQFINTFHQMDALPKQIKHRDGRSTGVNYHVGQLFQHKRYTYEGVIMGWDTSCEAGEEWIRHMGVDRLAGGKDQSFYHVLVSDKSVRYVAEENISTLEREPSEAMLKLVGRYFKRWDAATSRFVSNVKDEYPDD